MTLDEFKRLAEAATPGPWFNTSTGASVSAICTNPAKEHDHEPGLWIAQGSYDRGYDTSPDPWARHEMANFAFIAACREMVPKLIAVAEAAQSTCADHDLQCEDANDTLNALQQALAAL